MSLLHDIQTSLTQEGTDIGPILLKLRFLASRLSSNLLEEWMEHEANGYPEDVAVPNYRKVQMSHRGTFSGSYGSGIRNAPIPSYLIKKHAGEEWVTYEMRESIATIDDLIRRSNKGTLKFDASNLILFLQGKVYEDMACNSVTAHISKAALVGLQFSVRDRVLKLTIELEKHVPTAADITIGPKPTALAEQDIARVTNITNQVIYGGYTAISNSDVSVAETFVLNIGERDTKAFVEALTKNGIAESDAVELAKIVSNEEPQSDNEPFGVKAKDWLTKNIKKATDGTWQVVGSSVAEKLLTEALKCFYGL